MKKYPNKSLPTTYEELIVDIHTSKSSLLNPKGKTTISFENDDTIYNVDILYDGKYGKLIIPLDVKASCKIGKGTKWCTAAEEKNKYELYSEYGPLYIWVQKPGKHKYQFNWGFFEFKNFLNEDISLEKFNNFRNTDPVISELFAVEEKKLIDKIKSEQIFKGILKEHEKEYLEGFMKYYFYWLRGDWKDLNHLIEKDQSISKYMFELLNLYIDKTRYIRYVKSYGRDFAFDEHEIPIYQNLLHLFQYVKFVGITDIKIENTLESIDVILYILEKKNELSLSIQLDESEGYKILIYTWIDQYGVHRHETEIEDEENIKEKINNIDVRNWTVNISKFNSRDIKVSYSWEDSLGKHFYQTIV